MRDAFPKAKIRVRLDGGFASPEVLDFLDCEPKVEYLVNMAANAVLKYSSLVNLLVGVSRFASKPELQLR